MSIEQIVVEATSAKFANKFNSGSVLAGGKWLQVAKKLDLDLFQKDSQLTVETKTNAKGYTSIVGIVEEAVKEAPRKKAEPKTETKGEATTVKVNNYEDNKNNRILVQGITQAALQSPGLMSFSIQSVDDLAKAAQELADQMIEYVEGKVK